MRSYVNKKGETVNVSKEHLETAVELKQLLQKDSPSNRCSWAQHRRLMMAEGFEDSENSEPYRLMVKSYQRTIGKLSTAGLKIDDALTSKLESYKSLVGEGKWQSEENKAYLREINRGKKEIIGGITFLEEVTASINKVFSGFNWSRLSEMPEPPLLSSDGTRMVALVTDWHIGADVNVEGNRFNLAIARERINKYVAKVIELGRRNKVKNLDVVYMGDMVEGAFMREGQAYDIEFHTSDQMAIGGELMIEMLIDLSKVFHVNYRGFSGNHDRMNQQNKKGNITGDSAMVVVNKIVEVFIRFSRIERLTYTETHHSHAKLLDVNGVNIKLVHGDHEKKDDKKKIKDHSFNDGVNYDIIAYGHFHHFLLLEVGIHKFELRVGSIKGSDDYSETLGLGSAPSQAVIMVNKDGDIEIQRVGLS
jgi:predicted phosphodiesterase